MHFNDCTARALRAEPRQNHFGLGNLGRFRRIATAVAFVLSLFFVAPLAFSADRVVIGSTNTLLTALVSLAHQTGEFERQGVAVELVNYPTGNEALSALRQGKCDLAVVAETAFAIQSMSYPELRLFAKVGSWDNEVKVLARSDKGIREPSDLVGKRLGTQGKISTHYFQSMFLMRHNLSERVTEVFMRAPELPQALVDGRIDAMTMRNPYLAQAKKELGEKAVTFDSPGLYDKSFDLVGVRGWMESNPVSVDAVLRALIVTEEGLRQTPERFLPQLGILLKQSEKTLSDALEEVRLRVLLDEKLLYTLESIGRWGLDEGLVTAAAPPNFLDALDRAPLTRVSRARVTLR